MSCWTTIGTRDGLTNTRFSQQTYSMTLFKVPPRGGDQDKLLEMYSAMPQKALEVRPSQAKAGVCLSPSPSLSFLLSRVSQITPSFSASASPQDGSPFLISVKGGKTFTDQRAQEYTVAATSTFASKERLFEHYNTQCEAHKPFAGSVYWEIGWLTSNQSLGAAERV
jgi:hypothetical protein